MIWHLRLGSLQKPCVCVCVFHSFCNSLLHASLECWQCPTSSRSKLTYASLPLSDTVRFGTVRLVTVPLRSGLCFHCWPYPHLVGGAVLCVVLHIVRVLCHFFLHKPTEIYAHFIKFLKIQLLLKHLSSWKKEKHKWIIADLQIFHYRTCMMCIRDKQILFNSLQVVILAFKVGWLIHGVTHALNNM